jgi:hypothetical protein
MPEATGVVSDDGGFISLLTVADDDDVVFKLKSIRFRRGPEVTSGGSVFTNMFGQGQS